MLALGPVVRRRPTRPRCVGRCRSASGRDASTRAACRVPLYPRNGHTLLGPLRSTLRGRATPHTLSTWGTSAPPPGGAVIFPSSAFLSRRLDAWRPRLSLMQAQTVPAPVDAAGTMSPLLRDPLVLYRPDVLRTAGIISDPASWTLEDFLRAARQVAALMRGPAGVANRAGGMHPTGPAGAGWRRATAPEPLQRQRSTGRAPAVPPSGSVSTGAGRNSAADCGRKVGGHHDQGFRRR